MMPASLRPLAVETTLTAPDCGAAPTVIDEWVTVSASVGSVDAPRAALTRPRPAATARTALRSTTASARPPWGTRRLRLSDILHPFVRRREARAIPPDGLLDGYRTILRLSSLPPRPLGASPAARRIRGLSRPWSIRNWPPKS